MGYLCLVCKEKLSSPKQTSDTVVVDEEIFVDNNLLATDCGHLYHAECISSWWETERLKRKTSPETLDLCPLCQKQVESTLKIFPVEDHSESFDKATCAAQIENLNIYNNELQVQNEQLRYEIDILRERMSAPTSPTGDSEQLVMKNDRVVWLRKGEAPMPGVLTTISKKEGKLYAKVKLDKKQKNPTSNKTSNGILSSFRALKANVVVVPFDEIMAEKDFERSNSNNNYAINSSFTKKMYPQLKSGFRASTLSLPEDPRRLSYIEEEAFEAKNEPYSLHRSSSVASDLRSFCESQSFGSDDSDNFVIVGQKSFSNECPTPDIDDKNPAFSDLSCSLNASQSSILSRNSDSPNKEKKVTFADEMNKTEPKLEDRKIGIGDFVTWHANGDESYFGRVAEIENEDFSIVEFVDLVDGQKIVEQKRVPLSQLTMLLDGSLANEMDLDEEMLETPPPKYSDVVHTAGNSVQNVIGSKSLSPDNFLSPALYETLSKFTFDEAELLNGANSENSSCFDSLLLALFAGTNFFDKLMLMENQIESDLSRRVKYIIREKFVIPLRKTGTCDSDYAYRLQETILHLCGSYMDLEELVTVLFEFSMKLSPFIRYSFNMCDYLHQFFINFTSNNKITSVQNLFETSLMIQDHLKLQSVPSPLLILQMPRMDEKLMHHECVIPNIKLNIQPVIEKGEQRMCYCNNPASIECATCVTIHGTSAVVFCSNCKDVLEQLHNTSGSGISHSAKIRQLTEPTIPQLELLAVICIRADRYSTFLRNGKECTSPWTFFSSISHGQPKSKNLPQLGDWLQQIAKDPTVLADESKIPRLLQHLLTDSRVFIYHPERPTHSL